MPLDDTGYKPTADTTAQPAADRWSPAAPGSVPRLRPFTPRSDAQALLHIWQMLETRWARRFNDGDNHCIVGWVGKTCEPMSIVDWNTPQVKRVLQRLHDALPKSAQRKQLEHCETLARYNDTHSLPTVREWVRRAYTAEVNERIDALNNQPDA